MPRRKHIRLLLLILFVAINKPAAQDQNQKYLQEDISYHRFDEKTWRSLTSDLDYSPEQLPESPAEPAKPVEISTDGGAYFKFFIIVLGIALIFFLLVKVITGDHFFTKNNRKLPVTSGIDLDQLEENLDKADLKTPIGQAIAAGNYALAIRLYYLSVLQQLSQNGQIDWQKDKTNGAYLREMRNSPLFGTVQEITSIFEHVWYGNKKLEQADFLVLENKFIEAVEKATQV